MTPIGLTAFTDTGLVRDHNEDALLVGGWMCQSATGDLVHMQFDPDVPLVCAVADGMGGHAGGELASRVALGVVADASRHWRSASDIETTLVDTNDRVRQVGSNPDLRGLGTTIAGIFILDDAVIAFNVGDSRVYSINSGFLQQISVDDSVFDENGRPTNTITQSLGQIQPVTPHVAELPRDGATYLICSDGVSGGMSAAALRAAALKPTLRECVSSIVAGTQSNGAEDNFSVILVEVPPNQVETVPEPVLVAGSDTPGEDNNPAAPPVASAYPRLLGDVQ